MRVLSYSLLLLSIVLSVPLQAQFSLSEQLLEKVEKQYNRAARTRIDDWLKLINSPVNQQLSDEDKLNLVNDFFNSHVMFIDDIKLWKKADYWATPVEMLSIGAGDCEDYSIAKYFTLKELGVAEDKLRITYVKAVTIGQAHMVLTYFKQKRSVPLVLDNLIAEIKPASQRTDLVPVYSFNGTGLWLAKSRGEGQRVGEASRLSLWSELETRMKQELQVTTPQAVVKAKPSQTTTRQQQPDDSKKSDAKSSTTSADSSAGSQSEDKETEETVPEQQDMSATEEEEAPAIATENEAADKSEIKETEKNSDAVQDKTMTSTQHDSDTAEIVQSPPQAGNNPQEKQQPEQKKSFFRAWFPFQL